MLRNAPNPNPEKSNIETNDFISKKGGFALSLRKCIQHLAWNGKYGSLDEETEKKLQINLGLSSCHCNPKTKISNFTKTCVKLVQIFNMA